MKIILQNNYEIKILEKCDEKDRKKREQYFIDNLNCINERNEISKPRDVKKEYQHYKEQKKLYQEKNKEKKKNYDKIRRAWRMSWGLNKRDEFNLLYISPDLFN